MDTLFWSLDNFKVYLYKENWQVECYMYFSVEEYKLIVMIWMHVASKSSTTLICCNLINKYSKTYIWLIWRRSLSWGIWKYILLVNCTLFLSRSLFSPTKGPSMVLIYPIFLNLHVLVQVVFRSLLHVE